ncbi:hypothetical protein FH972_025904 [Carpinus fangiana]|uniref:Lysine-specific metallo-endopeptidase domain-containing protein n=1 Tax=Carpinus fangiana TaxID=176857 RepID=A0A5N6L2D2_9ROSI|nr:hypothetical protein FH972_025904 [Carpinus fangiana]
MHVSQISLLTLSACIAGSLAFPGNSRDSLSRRGIPSVNKPKVLSRRGVPNTGTDLDPPDGSSPPQNIDKVETAFNDAIELTSYVLTLIDSDTDIYPHYFADGDKAEIKRIFQVINNGDKGADFLNNVFVTTSDPSGCCTGATLACTQDAELDNPQITLCSQAFQKKAVTALDGKGPNDADSLDFYAACKADGGEIDQNVSYVFNTLGMTLLHEYMHMDKMVQASFGSIVDDPNGNPGYGPVNVYDNLAKDQARINADSYAYYASEVLWHILCQTTFQAPRPGTDDQDPTCGGVCQP